MSAAIKRINPRRAFQLTPQGLKRIVLGDTGGASSASPSPTRHASAPRPLRLQQDPTGSILVIAYSDRGVLDTQAHQAIAAAALLADPATAVAVLVMGELTEDLAPFGADRVYAAPACDRAGFNPALALAVAGDLVAHLAPRHILLTDTAGADGDLGRRLAARLRADVATHLVEVRPDAVAAYWQGGARLARRDLPRVLLLDPDTTDLALPFRGQGVAIDHSMPSGIDPAGYTDLGSPPVDAATLDLQDADFIVAAGNGVGDVATVEAVAGMFGAAIGASRVAVDDGKFARDRQIGATGKTVSANVYLAVGISGAVQHLQGIRACRHVIAINTDASAPIARRADLTIVDDAQAVMDALLDAGRNRNWPGTEGAP